jgi:hypothetical protein
VQNELPEENNEHMIDNLKVWFKFTESPDVEDDEKTFFHVILTPSKTVHDFCAEIATNVNFWPDQLTLPEHILDNSLKRPMHREKIVLETVLRWSE